MNKEIYIDGVDVSGCEFYWKEKELCNNCNLTSDCQEHKDCIYKRYMRKEQECEELKEQVKKYGEINEQETKDYAELKAENEELKKIIERLDVPKHEVIDMDIALENEKLKVENEEVKAKLINWLGKEGLRQSEKEFYEQQLDQLKQTLTEIKEIAEKIDDECGYEPYGSCTLEAKKQILQKISECEASNER